MRLKIILLLSICFTFVACGGGGSNSDTNDDMTEDMTSEEGTNPENDDDTEESDDSNNDDGSDDGGETGGDDTGGSAGNCITIPRPIVGQKITLKRTSDQDSTVSTETETVTVSNNTTLSLDTTYEQNVAGFNISSTGDMTFTYTIANNFRDITKLETNLVTNNSLTGEIETNLVNEYSPYWRVASDEICEGQTWTTDSVVTTTVTSSADPSANTMTNNQNIIFTIESVNIQKTVTAGTFSTYQIRQEDANGVNTIWFDKATGLWVISEGRNSDGDLIGTAELISMEQL
ncbi:hypothetical protein OO007_17565 [Cocleimonas sp. KMM 6892]|uniref:hypothetical protein n=1 Tax=unclassified Cocleimonas TaxID=2639732 RepID=UPI002DBEABA0|nr:MULTISPECIES: hypothetical protein [unclassified Cocleimonas]MEB8434052.1 hypothetical protein [Cocleimonas sp. KMM 6892]MEC4716863.1 hypothetical protein [Cocleimonas sp. KMM 6895]MEC4745982.1 hypothetical protein [Cocleimonas sp. KMM 6896]